MTDIVKIEDLRELTKNLGYLMGEKLSLAGGYGGWKVTINNGESDLTLGYMPKRWVRDQIYTMIRIHSFVTRKYKLHFSVSCNIESPEGEHKGLSLPFICRSKTEANSKAIDFIDRKGWASWEIYNWKIVEN